jgi:hypothetical protein
LIVKANFSIPLDKFMWNLSNYCMYFLSHLTIWICSGEVLPIQLAKGFFDRFEDDCAIFMDQLKLWKMSLTLL